MSITIACHSRRDMPRSSRLISCLVSCLSRFVAVSCNQHMGLKVISDSCWLIRIVRYKLSESSYTKLSWMYSLYYICFSRLQARAAQHALWSLPSKQTDSLQELGLQLFWKPYLSLPQILSHAHPHDLCTVSSPPITIIFSLGKKTRSVWHSGSPEIIHCCNVGLMTKDSTRKKKKKKISPSKNC